MTWPWTCYGDESVAATDDAVDGTDSLQSIVITPMSPASAARFWHADEPSLNDTVTTVTEYIRDTHSSDESVADADDTVDETDSLQSVGITPMSPASAARNGELFGDYDAQSDCAMNRDLTQPVSNGQTDYGMSSMRRTLTEVIRTNRRCDIHNMVTGQYCDEKCNDFDGVFRSNVDDYSETTCTTAAQHERHNDKCNWRLSHMGTRTGEKPYAVRRKQYVRRNNIQGHIIMRRHRPEGSHVCSYCSKTFATKYELTIHTRVHTGEKPYTCVVCGQHFSQSGTMRVHMRRHNMSDKPHVCSSWGKTFATKHKLTIHTRVHTGEKPYACSYCNKTFSDESNLKVHTRIHTGEKPYTCAVCGKHFNTLGNMRDHMLRHTSEKPYVCSYCNKTFVRKQELTIHTRLHTGEKPYTCVICRKHFSQSCSVQVHMRRHTSEKCSQTFKTHRQPELTKRNQIGEKLVTSKLRDEPMSEQVRHLKTHFNTQDGNDVDAQRSATCNNERQLTRNDIIKRECQSYNGESLGDYNSQTVGRKPQSDEMKTIAGLQCDQTECVATISCHDVKYEADEIRLEAAAEQKVNYRVLGGASTSSCRQREQQSELQVLSADRNHIVIRRTTNNAGDNESTSYTERIMSSHFLRTASESKSPNSKLDKRSNYYQRSNTRM